MTRYEWVAARKAEGFPITKACQTAQVSTSAFNDWRRRVAAGPTERKQTEERLVAEIRDIHADSDGTYGEPRITAELHARGWLVNHKRTERLMRIHGIVGVCKPPRVRTTIPAELSPPLPDLLGQRFAPGEPDVAWVGDITYVPTTEGWLYLSSVLDLGSRRWIGYGMADHMRTELVASALEMAVGVRRNSVGGIVFHSDRGSQYLSSDYQNLIAGFGMIQSVGRTGVCWDNAVAEAAFSSLKRELISRYRFATRAEARRAIFAWINRYNTRRRHSTLGYLTPTQWEAQYHQPQANQAA